MGLCLYNTAAKFTTLSSRGGLEWKGVNQIQVDCPVHSVDQIPLGAKVLIHFLNKKEERINKRKKVLCSGSTQLL